jgi:hypothetical protein
MHHADHERPPAGETRVLVCSFRAQRGMCVLIVVKMKMSVRVTFVLVPVPVHAALPTKSQVKHPCTQKNNHHGNRELERISQAERNRDFEHNDKDANDQQRGRVTDSPKRTDESGTQNGSLFADDRCDSYQMVDFSRVF